MKKQVTIYLDDELHKILKIKCIEEGYSVSEVTEMLYKRYIKEVKLFDDKQIKMEHESPAGQ